jgi:hypothetical protein
MPEGSPEPGSEAIKERLREVCRDEWGGNLTRMANALGMTQPALWKIVHGSQPLNAQLILALATHTNVNLHWVLLGEGPRTSEKDAALLRGKAVVLPKVPVASRPLPGSPQKHKELLTRGACGPLESRLSPSQYWLEIKVTDPIVRWKDEQVLPGDWLLIETDRVRFPREADMEGKLVIILFGVPDEERPTLGRVEMVHEDGLDVDTFDLGIDPSRVEEELVTRKLPNGKYLTFPRKYIREPGGATHSRQPHSRPVSEDDLYYNIPSVEYRELLGVCVLSVRPR